MPKLYPCPCCGHFSFSETSGSYEICGLCHWEDDILQLAFPDLGEGANKVSLIKAQENFMKSRVKEAPSKGGHLKDTQWCAVTTCKERILSWDNHQDVELWEKNKDKKICPYYWRSDYWLRK